MNIESAIEDTLNSIEYLEGMNYDSEAGNAAQELLNQLLKLQKEKQNVV